MKMFVNRPYRAGVRPFNLEALKQHCRVDDESETAALERIGYTAAREIEQFAQIALLTQAIRVTIFYGPADPILTLPIGPSKEGERPTVSINGAPFDSFDFVEGQRPVIVWGAAYFGLTPDVIIIEYNAGFGADAESIPHDLSEALLDQAALHYDGRSPMDARDLATSPHMARIGARYRGVKI